MRAFIVSLSALVACKTGGVLSFDSSSASAAPSAAPAPGAAPAAPPSTSGSSTTPPTSMPADADAPAPRAQVSTERVTVREGGGYDLTDAQRDADPYGDKIYPVVPLGTCADPGTMTYQNRHNLPAYPTQPSDPWHAVANDRPAALPLPEKRLNKASVYARRETTTCDGAHDHCFRDCTWIVRDPREEGVRTFYGIPAHLRPDGIWSRPSAEFNYRYSNGEFDYDIKPKYDAYRTVPATKRMLAEGKLVAVHEKVPTTEHEAIEPWRFGKVREIDWEKQTVALIGSPDVYPLAATRVVVLSYHDGGKVEIVDGRKKTELAVKASETFAPVPEP
jgi:hypothetical protein